MVCNRRGFSDGFYTRTLEVNSSYQHMTIYIYVVKDTNMQVGWAGSLSSHFPMHLPPSAALRIKLLGAAPKKSPVQVDLGPSWPSLICSPIFFTFFHRAFESSFFGPKMENSGEESL